MRLDCATSGSSRRRQPHQCLHSPAARADGNRAPHQGVSGGRLGEAGGCATCADRNLAEATGAAARALGSAVADGYTRAVRAAAAAFRVRIEKCRLAAVSLLVAWPAPHGAYYGTPETKRLELISSGARRIRPQREQPLRNLSA